MTKKYLSASILSCICMTVTGCGAGASNAVVSPAESIGKEVISADASAEYTTPEASTKDASLVPIDEWEENWKEIMGEEEEVEADYDESQYDEEIVKSNVDEVIKNSKSIAEEIEGIEKIANYYNGYHFDADISQMEMNAVSGAEPYTWELELDSLLKRALEEADASKKEEIQAEQKKWKADFDRCYDVLEYEEGSWVPMQNSTLDARFLKNRCYMLAKTLSDIKGDNYELPKRYFMDNAYVSDNGMLDISEGMEGGSIAITVVVDGKEVGQLAYDPLINDTTIEFKAQSGIEGKITYGWDGATLSITKSVNKVIPKGTELKFPTAL